eukprot:5231206-Amphidinium_carterae.1
MSWWLLKHAHLQVVVCRTACLRTTVGFKTSIGPLPPSQTTLQCGQFSVEVMPTITNPEQQGSTHMHDRLSPLSLCVAEGSLSGQADFPSQYAIHPFGWLARLTVPRTRGFAALPQFYMPCHIVAGP